MPSAAPIKIYLSVDAFRNAVEALSDSDWIRLRLNSIAYGVTGVHGFPVLEPENLLHEAFVRALEGRRRCPENVDVVFFITEVMRSIRSSAFKSVSRRNLTLVSSDRIIETEVNSSIQVNSASLMLDLKSHIGRELSDCDNDQIYLILEAMIEQMTMSEIMELTGLSAQELKKRRDAIRASVCSYIALEAN